MSRLASFLLLSVLMLATDARLARVRAPSTGTRNAISTKRARSPVMTSSESYKSAMKSNAGHQPADGHSPSSKKSATERFAHGLEEAKSYQHGLEEAKSYAHGLEEATSYAHGLEEASSYDFGYVW